MIDDKYEVLETLGQGAMGLVYKIHHRAWDLNLIVKMLLPHFIANADFKSRFILRPRPELRCFMSSEVVICVQP